ncbi:MAG: carbohydrate-binding protein, partial [Bacillota bacterium]|nr:carbohydrate-binding protein [Bacillota bacterium]
RLPKRSWYWYRNEYLKIAPPAWPAAGTASGLKLTADKTTIINDGTDDCQLIVKVVNSAGTQISNSPDVKLSIVSGPGQFPTGSSFTLTNKDYLKSMNDGMGAIEFRSYYSGTTVIKASSAGLPDATITIKVTGDDNGSQPTINPTPVNSNTPTPTPTQISTYDPNFNIAKFRPVKVSSQETTNSADKGNDGLDDTRWCSSTNKTGEWWQADLETFYYIYKTRVKFEKTGNYRYQIQMSNDETNWTTVVDNSATMSADQVREDTINGVQGRFIRILYTGLPSNAYASHFEFEVYGSTTPVSIGKSAFTQFEAENYDNQSGVQAETCNEGGQDVGYIENGDYTVYKNIDFGKGAASFQARVSSSASGGNIEIRLDSITGPLVGTCSVTGTGDWQTWATATCNVSGATGVHDVYLKFTGGSSYLFNLNWWKFSTANSTPTSTPTPVNSIDVNHDGVINMADVILLASKFNSVVGNPGYSDACDLNKDGAINMSDVIMIASKFNTIY